MKENFTPNELSVELKRFGIKVSTATLYNWMNSGKLKFFRDEITKTKRISLEELERLKRLLK